MLKKLDRHIISAISLATFVVLFALLSIDVLSKIISEIDTLGDKDYNFVRLISYVFGLVPLKLIQFFPMALLIGALMGLGKLANANELTVMLTSGISRLRIGIIGFFVAAGLGTGVLFIAEYVGVSLKQSVTQMRSNALGEVTQNYTINGVWAQSDNQFININGVKADGQLANIKIFSLDENMHIQTIILAESGMFFPGQWQLNQVTKKTIEKNQITITKMPTLAWDNTLDAQVIKLLISDPEDLSIRDLYRYIRYQKANEIEPTTYSLTFWQRLFVPLSTGVMFLLALPFVFGSQRNSSQGRKLFVGILLGLLYYVSYTSIANIILLTGAPIILGALIPIVLFAAVSFGLLWLKS